MVVKLPQVQFQKRSQDCKYGSDVTPSSMPKKEAIIVRMVVKLPKVQCESEAIIVSMVVKLPQVQCPKRS